MAYTAASIISESGLSGSYSGGWYGLLAPAGISKEVIDKLHFQTIKALQTPEVEQSLSNDGASLAGNTPKELSPKEKRGNLKLREDNNLKLSEDNNLKLSEDNNASSKAK